MYEIIAMYNALPAFELRIVGLIDACSLNSCRSSEVIEDL